MEWFFVLITVLGITTVAFIAKISSKHHVSAIELSTVIFAASTLISFIWFLLTPDKNISLFLLIFSFLAGIGGSLAVLFFNYAIRIGHFGFSNSIYRSSFILPIIFSFFFFSETLRLPILLGILLIIFSVFLISYSVDSFTKTDSIEFKWFVLIIVAFLLSGAPRMGQKMVQVYKENDKAYLFLSYLAGALTLIPFSIKQRTFSLKAVTLGSIAAIGSIAGVYCTIKALKLLPSGVVFPITLSGPIILGILLSLFLFKEKIKPVGYFGITLGLLGIIVLYIWK